MCRAMQQTFAMHHTARGCADGFVVLIDHIENFFAAIRNQAKPNCPFETGFQTSIACRMAVESLWSGRTVRWDANLEQIV